MIIKSFLSVLWGPTMAAQRGVDLTASNFRGHAYSVGCRFHILLHSEKRAAQRRLGQKWRSYFAVLPL